MRITLILLAFICLSLNAQDENKAALTAGSEFLNNNETPQSITTSQTMMVSEPAYRNEVPALTSVKTEYGSTTSGKLNPLVYVLVFILFGLAFYFIKAKNKAPLNTSIPLENEEDEQRKKQLWTALAENKEED
jgi:hypothetical protein